MSLAPRDQLAVNLAHWDEVAELHRESYDVAGLIADPKRLSRVVADDTELLLPFLPGGSVTGLTMLHLQCHIGTDTLSWARLGAKMTGLDLSGESLRVARDLADQAGLGIEYVQSSIAAGATALQGRQFDIVYTSIGVLAWLDDLDVWARLIAGVLKSGGTFFIREGHPSAMALEYDGPPGELRLTWPYFNTGPLFDDSPVDYSSSVPVEHAATYEWAHSLEDIVGSLLRAGLTLISFREHQTLPWPPMPWMIRLDNDCFALPEPVRNNCPLAFSIVAQR